MDKIGAGQDQGWFELDHTKLVNLFNDTIDVIGHDLNQLSERAQDITMQEEIEIENFFKTKEDLFAEFTSAAIDDLTKRNHIISKLKQLSLDIHNFKKNKLGSLWS